jgi:sugar phosphate isomerase/epimerase
LLQPKVALKYDFNSNNSIYATVSRGTRSGGYNVQMFSDLLQTELDQCWVKYAGQDPVAYLQKYEGRSPVVHLKDYYASGEQKEDPYALIGLNEGEKKENTAFEFRPLGYGIQDIPAIIEASKKAGSKWLIVEQDQPSMGKTPMECAAMSMEYLKNGKK